MHAYCVYENSYDHLQDTEDTLQVVRWVHDYNAVYLLEDATTNSLIRPTGPSLNHARKSRTKSPALPQRPFRSYAIPAKKLVSKERSSLAPILVSG